MTLLKALPTQLDLLLYAGDGCTLVFSFLEEGQPWPTTGTWAADVRASEVGPVITSFTINNDETTGVVKASLSGAQVRSLGNEAVWDLQQTPPSAEPRTWYRGKIDITGDVTRGD